MSLTLLKYKNNEIVDSGNLKGDRVRYTPNSKKVALGIGSWALGSYCLAVTQAKHPLFSYAQTIASQRPIANA